MDDEVWRAVLSKDVAELKEWRPHILEDMRYYVIQIEEDPAYAEAYRSMLEELTDMLTAIDEIIK
jgi:hypothetical protein